MRAGLQAGQPEIRTERGGRAPDSALPEHWGAANALELVRAGEWATLTAIAREARVLRTGHGRRPMRLRVLVERGLRRAAKVPPPKGR